MDDNAELHAALDYITELEAENAALKVAVQASIDIAERRGEEALTKRLQLEDELAALRSEREPSEQRREDLKNLRLLVNRWNNGYIRYLSDDNVALLARVLDENERSLTCTAES